MKLQNSLKSIVLDWFVIYVHLCYLHVFSVLKLTLVDSKKVLFCTTKYDVFCGTAAILVVFLAGVWSKEHMSVESTTTANLICRCCAPLLNAIWLFSAKC